MADLSKENNEMEKDAKEKPDTEKAALNQEVARMKTTQLELLHKKTHQDLINAAYKAAEELKIAPWVLIRAAGWGNFTEDRGAHYNGDHIDDIKTLSEEQKEALMGALGMQSGWEVIKKAK